MLFVSAVRYVDEPLISWLPSRTLYVLTYLHAAYVSAYLAGSFTDILSRPAPQDSAFLSKFSKKARLRRFVGPCLHCWHVLTSGPRCECVSVYC